MPERHAKDPNAKRVQVEDAMAVMLKNLHGIVLPRNFFTVNSGFQAQVSATKEVANRRTIVAYLVALSTGAESDCAL